MYIWVREMINGISCVSSSRVIKYCLIIESLNLWFRGMGFLIRVILN